VQQYKADLARGIAVIEKGISQAHLFIEQPVLIDSIAKMLQVKGGNLSTADLTGIALRSVVPGAPVTPAVMKALSSDNRAKFEKAFAAAISILMPGADMTQVMLRRNNYITALEWVDIAKDFAQKKDYRSAVTAFHEATALDISVSMDKPIVKLANQWYRQSASQDRMTQIVNTQAWIEIAKDYASKGNERMANAAIKEAEVIGGLTVDVTNARKEIPILIDRGRAQNVEEAKVWLSFARTELINGNANGAISYATEAIKTSSNPVIRRDAESIRIQAYNTMLNEWLLLGKQEAAKNVDLMNDYSVISDKIAMLAKNSNFSEKLTGLGLGLIAAFIAAPENSPIRKVFLNIANDLLSITGSLNLNNAREVSLLNGINLFVKTIENSIFTNVKNITMQEYAQYGAGIYTRNQAE